MPRPSASRPVTTSTGGAVRIRMMESSAKPPKMDLAARLVKDHIYVTCLAPGAFPSNMNKVARDHADMVATRIPAKRIGRDEDMAAAAIFLASKAGDYVVGDSIAVDGGVAYASIAEI